MEILIWLGHFLIRMANFWMEHLIFINIILSIVIVFFERRDPKTVWTWLLVLYFIPILGIFLYFIIGYDFHKRQMFRTKEIEDAMCSAVRGQEESIFRDEFAPSDPRLRKFSDTVLMNLEAADAVYTGKIRERITPELPRAPRSMAEAQRADAWAAVVGAFCRSSAAAVPRVRPMLVPVSPSGTGNTLSSLIFCFSAFREADAWTSIAASVFPSTDCTIVPLLSPLSRSPWSPHRRPLLGLGRLSCSPRHNGPRS